MLFPDNWYDKIIYFSFLMDCVLNILCLINNHSCPFRQICWCSLSKILEMTCLEFMVLLRNRN